MNDCKLLTIKYSLMFKFEYSNVAHPHNEWFESIFLLFILWLQHQISNSEVVIDGELLGYWEFLYSGLVPVELISPVTSSNYRSLEKIHRWIFSCEICLW